MVIPIFRCFAIGFCMLIHVFLIGYRMVLPNWLYVPPTEAITMIKTGLKVTNDNDSTV